MSPNWNREKKTLIIIKPQSKFPSRLDLSQPVDGFHVSSFLDGVFLNMVPPLEQEVVHDESEPRRQLQTLLPGICLSQQLLQLLLVYVLDISYLIRVRRPINISAGEEKVINCKDTNSHRGCTNTSPTRPLVGPARAV